MPRLEQDQVKFFKYNSYNFLLHILIALVKIFSEHYDKTFFVKNFLRYFKICHNIFPLLKKACTSIIAYIKALLPFFCEIDCVLVVLTL